MEPGRTAIGTWGGGRFMHFGEALDDERLEALFRPGDGIDTVITADVYGAGEADRMLGVALAGLDRDSYSLVGAVGHDFVDGERDGPRGFPRFTDPACAAPTATPTTCAPRPRRASSGSASPRSTCSCCTTPIASASRPRRSGTRWPRFARRASPPRSESPRSGQRLHARPDRVLRALRRAARLGDGDPQPARALAG